MDDETAVKIIQELLQDLGYRAQNYENKGVGSSAGGIRFLVLPYNSSIQFRCGVTLEEDNQVTSEKINNFNRERRFCKAYLDKDGDLVLEADWWIDLESSEAREIISHALRLWERSLSLMLDSLT